MKEKYENFEGRLNGAKYPYEYISAGERKAGLIYYLQADSRTIYRIEFTGSPEHLADLGNQTDFIAASFRPKYVRVAKPLGVVPLPTESRVNA